MKDRISAYNHQHLIFRRRICRFLMNTIAFTLLIKLDRVEGMENVPRSGPALVYINHIAFVDPIVFVHVFSRDVVPMAKIEVYNYPVVGIFPRLWGVIPVRRSEIDRRAIQMAVDVLDAGEIVLVAPEGTRHPAITDVKEGLAYLATRTGVPLLPCVIDGTVGFPAMRYSARWHGAGVRVRIGKPFRFIPQSQRVRKDQLHQMNDEAMYILAAMLPEHLRGDYHDLSKATQNTIEWL